jgi:hypothetical protein
VRGAVFEVFGSKNVPGRFRSGKAISFGIGLTISGVTRTSSSELFFVIERDLNRFPKSGMLDRPGTL